MEGPVLWAAISFCILFLGAAIFTLFYFSPTSQKDDTSPTAGSLTKSDIENIKVITSRMKEDVDKITLELKKRKIEAEEFKRPLKEIALEINLLQRKTGISSF